MAVEIESIFYRWVEDVWNDGNELTINELFHETGVADYQFYHGTKPIHGKRRLKSFIRRIRQIFGEIEVTVDQITSDKNKVVAVCTFAAKSSKPKNGSLIINEPISVKGLCQVTFVEGKIIHTWNNLDLFGTNSKIGDQLRHF